ncbi:SIR2 family protein [Megasphaera coli]|uniref:SIR2 family protein n=1 Tax=Colibacter massiliensis TaxID=1852379 RepID=UPI00094E94F1|nr:SIR2 family protein [Colibacter massiliensis]
MEPEELDKLVRGKNINFLIGAGASVPMYPSLSFGKNYPTFEDIASHTQISKQAKIFMYIYYFMKWIEPMGVNKKVFQSSCSDNEVFVNYKRLIKCFYNYLQCESNETPKRINIFTTNYDLLFERTFDDFLFENPLIYFNDGSRGVFTKYVSNKNFYLNVTHSGYNDNYKREVPTVNLFKLHGSLSWKLFNDKILVNENNSVICKIKDATKKLKIKLEQVNSSIEHSKQKDVNLFVTSLNESVSKLHLNNDLLDDFYDTYSQLPIINPNKYKFFKTVSEQYYYQLIRSFSYELERKQAILIVFGFSFADEHLRDIFERSLLNPELQVILISYSKEGQDALKKLFGGYKNIKFLPESFDDTIGDFNYLLSLLGDCNEE